ncbi:class II aldolase/adducin family protein [Flavonifractor plautii]|nr:class II aldolase/adducin family protein [Flavonifractor plautii]
MKYEDIRRQVLTAIRQASAQGLIHGTSGNISVRDREAGVAAITPSGRPYDTMEPGDIAIVTLDGEWVDGPYAPSSETPMHTAVYRARPDVGAVVHNHALFCTVMAMAVDELPPPRRPRRSSPHPGGALRGARLPGAGRLSGRRPGDGRAGRAAAQSRQPLLRPGPARGHDRRRLCGGGGPGGLLRLRPGPLHPTGRGGHSGL